MNNEFSEVQPGTEEHVNMSTAEETVEEGRVWEFQLGVGIRVRVVQLWIGIGVVQLRGGEAEEEGEKVKEGERFGLGFWFGLGFGPKEEEEDNKAWTVQEVKEGGVFGFLRF